MWKAGGGKSREEKVARGEGRERRGKVRVEGPGDEGRKPKAWFEEHPEDLHKLMKLMR